jgi:RNA polymerase sigma factor (sigma-70 family)
MRLDNLPCDELWWSFKNGDRRAFESIYIEHIRSLINYGYKVTSDRALIDDSIQDLFFELWESRANVSETLSIKFYLFKALRYKICRNLKATERNTFQDIEEFQNELASHSHEAGVIDFEVEKLKSDNLRMLVSQLPRRQQEAINLRFYHNFSNDEIAQIMGVNYQSVSNFIYSALQKLKVSLKLKTA